MFQDELGVFRSMSDFFQDAFGSCIARPRNCLEGEIANDEQLEGDLSLFGHYRFLSLNG